jgi:TonB-dependent receptor
MDLPLLKQLDLSGGARLEHVRIQVNTFDPFDSLARAAKADRKNLDVLPYAALNWRFVDDFQARAGYSRTLNRPDFRELSSGRYFDLEQNLLLVGNPDVKRALIENFDARVEWYFTPDEVFSVGGFVKRFQDPIEDILVAGVETIRSVRNIDKALSYGLELEGRKRFGFITPVLNALYLSSNVSLIDSKVEVPLKEGVHKRGLQGQSPWVVNVQFGWDDTDKSGTAASLLFNSAGKRIRFVGDEDQGVGDTYELPIHRMDFVISQKLPRKFNLGARVRNLLNAWETWKESGITTRRFRRGADFQLSLSWSY